jgi:hypothetical protein
VETGSILNLIVDFLLEYVLASKKNLDKEEPIYRLFFI